MLLSSKVMCYSAFFVCLATKVILFQKVSLVDVHLVAVMSYWLQSCELQKSYTYAVSFAFNLAA